MKGWWTPRSKESKTVKYKGQDREVVYDGPGYYLILFKKKRLKIDKNDVDEGHIESTDPS